MRGERVGALIGSIAGLVFILINAGGLPGPIALAVRLLGVLGFLAVLWFGIIRPAPDAALAQPPESRAMRVYWLSVLGEAVAIPLGAWFLNSVINRPELTIVWVVFVVGAHFLPFAKAFRAPVFRPLSWTLIGLAAAGAVVTTMLDPGAAPVTGILAGVALLAFSFLGTRRPSETSQPRSASAG